uniref:Uncharacterized protein n=1 Tax=Fagus sylvatica TaxID=28930 RepID=A0A2N9J253_FAGSY
MPRGLMAPPRLVGWNMQSDVNRGLLLYVSGEEA